MPGISARRGRAILRAVDPFYHCRYKAKRYFRDLCPGFPQGARAHGIARSRSVFYCRYKEKRYFRDLRPRFPRGARAVFVEVHFLEGKTLLPGSMPGISAKRARAQYWRSKTVLKQNATSGIYARDFRGARTRTPNPSK